MIPIRKETPQDIQGIRDVNERAFAQSTEADLVDRLRQTCPNAVSLVAAINNKVIGHILFTPVTIETKDKIITGMGLAPMAVLPEFQRRGIGSNLVKAGIAEMERRQEPFILVVGHPEYYPRFGFVPASRYSILSEYDNVPDEAFMILVLQEDTLQGISGIAKYRPEFRTAM